MTSMNSAAHGGSGNYMKLGIELAIAAAAIAVFGASFAAMRTQAAVGDAEFLRSMIPHHSGAILMCREAELSDPDIVALCREIVRSQTEEIARMEALLQRQRDPA
jgi:uncharacterized protein (DUF305 family)